jgi:uncharacterized protein YggU (UPF0235/DUF167 family)
MEPPIKATATGVQLRVRLTPRADRDAIDGVRALADGRQALSARVRAVPEKGAANSALETLVAVWAGVPASSVSIGSGQTQRVKSVDISGETVALLARCQNALVNLNSG